MALLKNLGEGGETMKPLTIFLWVLFIVLCSAVSSCSSRKEAEEKTGEIERFTDQMAQEAVKGIRGPISKARAVDELATERVKQMDGTGYGE